VTVDISEDNLLDILKEYETKGFTGQFSSRLDSMVHCHTCNADEPAAQTAVHAMHRFEGTSDPGDEAVLVALECVSCGGWGTAHFAYGSEADPHDAAVLQELLDARDISPIDQ
jgi:hypothetical protein